MVLSRVTKKKETDGGWELTFKKGAGVGNVS